jgi:hypothetical protein
VGASLPPHPARASTEIKIETISRNVSLPASDQTAIRERRQGLLPRVRDACHPRPRRGPSRTRSGGNDEGRYPLCPLANLEGPIRSGAPTWRASRRTGRTR